MTLTTAAFDPADTFDLTAMPHRVLLPKDVALPTVADEPPTVTLVTAVGPSLQKKTWMEFPAATPVTVTVGGDPENVKPLTY